MEKLLNILENIRCVNIVQNEAILYDFNELFNQNSENIKHILEKENDAMKANYSYYKLKSKFDLIKDYEFDELKKYSGIGTIVCVTNGDPYLVLELMIKVILTKNKIVFLSDSYMNSINIFLVELMKKVLEKYQVSQDVVSIMYLRNYKMVSKVIDKIDCIIVNKEYEIYKEIQEICNIKTIYLDYGNINIYSEGEEFDAQIKEVCTRATKENKQVYLAKTDDIQEHLDNMNNNVLYHAIVIYTKNAEKCTYFLKNIKAENIYINTNPFNYNESIISEYEFVYKKKVVY